MLGKHPTLFGGARSRSAKIVVLLTSLNVINALIMLNSPTGKANRRRRDFRTAEAEGLMQRAQVTSRYQDITH
jgi:hypothetical protein